MKAFSQTPHRPAQHAGGFTLFELIVVLVLALILGAFVVRSIMVARQRGIVGQLRGEGARSGENDKSFRMLDLAHLPSDEIDIEEIVKLTELRSLNLDHSEITNGDLIRLANSLELTQIHLCGTELSDAGAAELARFTRLIYLDARATFLTDAGVGRLSELTKMRELRLAQTSVTDRGLRHLRDMDELKVLDLRHTDITDAGLSDVARLPSLRILRLTNSRVTQQGVDRLVAVRPDLNVEFDADAGRDVLRVSIRRRKLSERPTERIDRCLPVERPIVERLSRPGARARYPAGFTHHVSLTEPFVDDELIRDIDRLRALRSIHISNCSITDVGLEPLTRNRCLDHVHLDAPITDAGLHHVGRIPCLTFLTLRSTRITDEGLAELKDCRHLEVLDLHGAPVSDKGIEALTKGHRIRRLLRIDLTGTRVTLDSIIHLKRLFPSAQVHYDPDLTNGVSQEKLKELSDAINLATP